MPTALGRYVRAGAEAGWLLVLLATPLFFNPYASNLFELAKVGLLRPIAVIVLGGLVIGVLENPGRPWGRAPGVAGAGGARLRAVPLLLPAAMLAIVVLVSTLASVAPRLSAWGTYHRLQGAYTTAGYLAIFIAIGSLLRERQQLDRVRMAVVLASVPVSLYAVLQHNCLDPLWWRQDTAARAASTLGNATFLPAFLIMCVPLTLAELISCLGASRPAAPSVLRATACGAVLPLQLLAILYSRGRGAWLGLLAGLGLFGFLGLVALRRRSAPAVARRRGLRWLWLAWLFAAVVAGVLIVVLNLPHGPLAGVATLPYVDRLAHLTEPGRLLIWQGVVDLLLGPEPSGPVDGRRDELARLRFLVGYGPETLALVFPRVAPPALARLNRGAIDRSHGQNLDALIETGVLGLLAYAGLVGAMIVLGLDRLGLARTTGERKAFWTLWFGLGAVATLAARWLDGSWRLAGVALAAGMLLGLLSYLVMAALRHPAGPVPVVTAEPLLVIGLLAAIVAHFVEVQFGIAITATRSYFWAYAGLLVAVGQGDLARSLAAPVPVPVAPETAGAADAAGGCERAGAGTRTPGGLRSVLASAAITVFVLVTLIWTISPSGPLPGRASVLVWLLGTTALLAGLLALSAPDAPTAGLIRPAAVFVLAIGAGVTLYASVHWLMLRADLPPAGQLGVYEVTVLLTLLALATIVAGDRAGARPSRALRRPWAALAVLAVAAVLVFGDLRLTHADVYHRQASVAFAVGHLDRALELSERVLRLAPRQDVYHASLGRALVARALLTKDLGPPGALRAPSTDGAGEAFLRRAEEAFERARALSPLEGNYVRDLAWLYQLRASHPRRPGVGDPDLVRSLALYTEASRLQPTDARLLVEWGWSHVLLGQLDDAYERYRRALWLDPERAETRHALWRLHLARAEAATSDTSRRAEIGQAGEARRRWDELRAPSVAPRPPPRCPAAS